MKTFLQSVKQGRVDIVRGFLDISKTFVNRKEERYGRTALMIASMRGDVEMVNLLLEKGAKINLLD